MKEIQNAGLYIIRDEYFAEFANDKFMFNKNENRPHYYAIKDKTGILWMIPLSTKVEKYRRLIENTEKKHKKCVYYHTAPIYGKMRAFVICDMFPVTEEYILRPYKIGNSDYVVMNKNIKQAVYEKARSYLSMVESGALCSPLNILDIRRKLLEK